MKANPGGQIAPVEVIGREQLIRDLWHRLEQQSLVLSAERRIGKTCLLKKMKAEAPPGKLLIYHDLEQVRSSLEFVEVVLQDVEGYLSGLQRTATRTRQLLQQISGAEFKGFKLPNFTAFYWKTLLIKTIADLVEHQDRVVILLWDEVPYMLDKVGNTAAMEILDTLRSLRQMYPTVRMVFTGSIGLHHVIASLRKAGYANEPTNDMYLVDVPPLSLNDATELARQLLLGEKISTSSVQETATAIAQSVDCIPFYIHHLILKLKLRGCAVNQAVVTEVINDCLIDPLNPWKMEHYRERIDNYYNDKQRLYAFNLLDILADTDRPLLFNEILNRLRLEQKTQDREITRSVLRLLQRYHYIIQQSNRAYSFRYPLIQLYWKFLKN